MSSVSSNTQKDIFITFLNISTHKSFVIQKNRFSSTTLAAMITGIFIASVCIDIALTGNFQSVHQTFLQWTMKTVTVKELLMAAGICAILLGGTLHIIRRAVSAQPVIGEKNRTITGGKLTGAEHWEPVYVQYYKGGKKEDFYDFMDLSTLDHLNTGTAYVYSGNSETIFPLRNIGILALLPLYAAGVVVRNVLHFFVSPFYVMGGLIYERNGKPIDPERFFHWSDMIKEPAQAVQRVVALPFYTLAIAFSVLYSFIDPLNGCKLQSLVERYGNNNIPRHRGIWLFLCQREFTWIRGAATFSHVGYYLMGCRQPQLKVEFKKGEIKKVQRVSNTLSFKPCHTDDPAVTSDSDLKKVPAGMARMGNFAGP